MVMLVALTLGLGACDQEPKPIMPDPSSGSPSTGHPSTPDASELGPKAFIREYFRRVSEATTTGDPESFQELSGTRCQNCRDIARNIRLAYKSGGEIETRPYRVLSIHVLPDVPHGFKVGLSSGRERWRNGDGQVTQDIAPGIRTFNVQLKRGASGWRMDGLELT